MQIVESVVSTLQTNQIDFLFVRRTDLFSIENKFRAIHIGLWLLSTLVSEIATEIANEEKKRSNSCLSPMEVHFQSNRARTACVYAFYPPTMSLHQRQFR